MQRCCLTGCATSRSGVSYDINVRPSVIADPDVYWGKVQPWLRVVGRRQGIVKASDEDIKFLAKAEASGVGQGGGRSGRAGRHLGRAVRAGACCDHAWAGRWSGYRASGNVTRVPGFPTKVVDTVGAGDTFMAGFLDGWVKLHLGLEASLERGAAAASIVCSRRWCATADVGGGRRSDRGADLTKPRTREPLAGAEPLACCERDDGGSNVALANSKTAISRMRRPGWPEFRAATVSASTASRARGALGAEPSTSVT